MLEIKGIDKQYKGKAVLKAFSIKAAPGDCIGVVGKNGAGKTTLFSILSDVLLADKGSIHLDGKEITGNYPNEVKARMGVFIGMDLLIEEMSGYQYLEFISSFYKLQHAKQDISELVQYFFEDVAAISLPIKGYSFGMRQKILLIASLLHKPSILILDEPFNGLDIFSTEKLIRLLQSIKPHTITFIASHNLSFLDKLVNRIVIIDQGDTLFEGTVEDFKWGGSQAIEEALFKLLQPASTELDNLNWFSAYGQRS